MKPRLTAPVVTVAPQPADLATLLDHALDERWRKYRKLLRRCRNNCSEETVHDLRVATRRLLATLNVVKAVNPDAVPPKTLRRLKKRFDKLSPLRDAQVQLAQVEMLAPVFPALDKFRAKLADREARLIAKVANTLATTRAAKLAAGVESARARLRAHAALPMDGDLAVRAVNAAFSEVRDCRRHLRADDAASIHRMRIAFKKFRYTAETLRPLLPLTDAQFGEMNAYQTLMGDIQDAEVLLANLAKFAKKKKARRRDPSLREALRALSERRDELVEAYLASADKVDTFWQPLPVPDRAPFPFEKQLAA
jgi:CHAD domain-containing protein